jgi:predicted aconitase
MELTDRQRQMLEGEDGPIIAMAMNYLVKYGEAMSADKLIPVKNVHTVFTIPMEGEAEQVVETLKMFGQLRVKIPTTTHVGFIDFKKWREFGIEESRYELQSSLVPMAAKAGIQLTWTCAPEIVGNAPLKGQTCAWMESAAITYANGILGARTNREGAESTVPAAFTGLIPRFGNHITENRRGTILIDVEADLENLTDWSTLGYFGGDLAGLGVPVFGGVGVPALEEAKGLCAALATEGGVGMFHIIGVTPEAPTEEAAFQGGKPKSSHTFTNKDKDAVYERLNNCPTSDVDIVMIGCPHATLTEIVEVAHLLEGKKISENTDLWIATTDSIRSYAEKMGYDKMIADAGGKIMADTCPCISQIEIARDKNYMTNSVKQAYYAPGQLGAKVHFANTKECVEAAVNGKRGA